MSESVQWCCDFPNCTSAAPRYGDNLHGWWKVTISHGLAEPATFHMCPGHTAQLPLIADLIPERMS